MPWCNRRMRNVWLWGNTHGLHVPWLNCGIDAADIEAYVRLLLSSTQYCGLLAHNKQNSGSMTFALKFVDPSLTPSGAGWSWFSIPASLFLLGNYTMVWSLLGFLKLLFPIFKSLWQHWYCKYTFPGQEWKARIWGSFRPSPIGTSFMTDTSLNTLPNGVFFTLIYKSTYFCFSGSG